MRIIAWIVGVVVVLAGAYWLLAAHSAGAPVGSQATTTPQATASTSQTLTAVATSTNLSMDTITSATLHTSMGDITISFYKDQAPQTVANFIKLASAGFYDGTKFHRVIKGFMDQGGDPLTKDDTKQPLWGTGGPGYTIVDEFGTTYPNTAGTVAMANTGAPNSAGSQFFINAVDNHFLDGKYAVFGHVTSGMSVVEAINNTPTDGSDRPLTPVVLTSITLQ